MPKIVPIVEGEGDIEAVPILLRYVLHELLHKNTWNVIHPKKAHSLPALHKKLGKYLHYCEIEEDAQAILILLDLDDGCPAVEAQSLANDICALSPKLPVAIVFAHREYEAWFLASVEMMAQAQERGRQYHFSQAFLQNPTPPSDVESIRDAKGWISRQMIPGYRYKETSHQPSMTTLIDFNLATQRSRSLRRLLYAVEFLVQHAGQSGFVSPQKSIVMGLRHTTQE
jgi:hypothetical protein